MQWKIIKDFEDYKVSNTGEVFSIKRNKMLKPYEKKNYLGVYLYQNNIRKFMTIHRLVALSFIDNPNKYPQINHKDENTKNNCVENLEWCSAKYNANYGTLKERKRERMLKNNHFKGKHHSEESKLKMRNAKLGKILSEETKKKIGANNKGKGRFGNPVYCVELNKTFMSALDAERQTGIPNSNIIQVCNNKRKTAGKYHWQYKKEDK